VFSWEDRGERSFPPERAILFSLGLHVLLFFLLVVAPARQAVPDPGRSSIPAFVSPEELETKIPVEFMEAPGPSRENPRPSALSDLDRRAGGGDPARPKSSRPYVAEAPGVTGLEPGQSAARQASPARPEGEGGGETSGGSERPFLEEKTSDSGLVTERRGGEGGSSRLADLDRAIREAAQGAGSGGEQGAGFPNPDGGFVDSGPLSFDTTWYDWGPYAAEMVRRIKLHWEIPSLARLGWKGKLTIRFFILADGRVEGATIIRGSGVPPFDFAALQAILKSSPFRPLPNDLGSTREGVTVTFFYNMRPSSEEPEPTR
jgi:TonB family protein